MSKGDRGVRGLDGGERAALLVSECQNWNTDPAFGRRPVSEQAAERQIISKISNLARACRQADVPVFAATHTPRADYAGMKANCVVLHWLKKEADLYEGSPAAALNPALELDSRDWIFARRQGLTDFSGSELDQVLRNYGVETVLLTGVSTNLGLLGNAIDIVNRGWNAILVEDCTAGAPPEHHDYLVRTTYPLITTVTTSYDVIATLAARQGVR